MFHIVIIYVICFHDQHMYGQQASWPSGAADTVLIKMLTYGGSKQELISAAAFLRTSSLVMMPGSPCSMPQSMNSRKDE